MTTDDSNGATPILDTYEAYGCRVNAISTNELFQRYEQAGFLYPAKIQRLAPFWPLVRENWERASRGGELIHYVVSAELADGAWASITSWRHSCDGWNTQHLIGIGGPSASRATMLAAQAVRIRDQYDKSHQNWFQRSNRFANKVFGSIGETVGEQLACVRDYTYFAFANTPDHVGTNGANVRVGNPTDADQIRSLARSCRSSVYLAAEGLDEADLCLESVDELYRKVGLRRYRKVLVAEHRGYDELAGVALAYRGPLGLNFSFLENRCDLILNKALTEDERRAVIAALISAAAEHYRDFPPRAVLVVADLSDGEMLRSLGGQHIRDYAQSVWLRDGFEAWYRHVERIYDRIARAEKRVGLGRRKAEDGT